MYLYNSTADHLHEMSNKLSYILSSIALKNAKNKPEHDEVIEGPYYCVDYIFIHPIKIKLYTLSSTNLHLINLIPNLEFTIKVGSFMPRYSDCLGKVLRV